MYSVIREHRKTITIKVEDNLEVILKAPYGVPNSLVEATYKAHEQWIRQTIERKAVISRENNWIQNRQINYLGETKVIQFVKSKDNYKCVKLVEDKFYIFTPNLQDESLLRRLLQDYYKQTGKLYLTQKANEYCELLGCRYKNITLKNQKTRWGSCSNKGNLNYNLRIMCAPKEMVDYIALHEVVHLIHFNHSREFWKVVEGVMPDYRERQSYFELKGNSLYV